jgi:hypothetical protein
MEDKKLELTRGQRIRTVYQDWATVLRQCDNVVLTYELSYVHVDKIVEVRRQQTTDGIRVKYRGKTYRVIKRGYLGDWSLYKLASNFRDGSPFGAKVDECEVIE